MLAAAFQFDLPPELIAQAPAQDRDASRLLLLQRNSGLVTHRRFKDLPGLLRAGDVLVLNDSKVIPARLRGVNRKPGGEFEFLLLKENCPNDWWALVRPGKRARVGTEIHIRYRSGKASEITATVLETNAEGHRRLQFRGVVNLFDQLNIVGEMPVPPYIRREAAVELMRDFDRYQTVFAKSFGSVAAPTAGLHFTETLFRALRRAGIELRFVTLHVGLGTFAPVKANDVADHVMHEERFIVSEETARSVNTARAEGRRIVCVGTTSLRVLESVAATNDGRITSGAGRTRIFIYPPFRFRVADALVTNFHLPCSTLLMLVSAFAAPGETRGRELILHAYAEAIRERYRFFSYGDAMLIL